VVVLRVRDDPVFINIGTAANNVSTVLALTVMVKFRESIVNPSGAYAVTVNEYTVLDMTPVILPLITPVDAFNDSPPGSAPDVNPNTVIGAAR
jgi:hypothetical protein